MKTCATCKHWDSKDVYRSMAGLGICRAVPMFWDATEWKEDGDGRQLMPKYAKATAFAQDGSDYQAFLYTRSEHGCTMHEGTA